MRAFTVSDRDRLTLRHLPDCFGVNLGQQLGNCGIKRHGTQVALQPVAHGNRASIAVFLADHEHIWDQINLSVANFRP